MKFTLAFRCGLCYNSNVKVPTQHCTDCTAYCLLSPSLKDGLSLFLIDRYCSQKGTIAVFSICSNKKFKATGGLIHSRRLFTYITCLFVAPQPAAMASSLPLITPAPRRLTRPAAPLGQWVPASISVICLASAACGQFLRSVD